MPLADRDSQERATGIRDAEVGAQFQQRQSDPLMQAEAQEAGAAQEKPIPLLKIGLMKLSEGGLRRMRGDGVELLPTEAAHAAIVVGLDLESRGSKRKRREFRDRPGRQEGDYYPLGSYVKAGQAGSSGQKNVRGGGQLRLTQDNLSLGEVGNLQCGYEISFVGTGEPGKRGRDRPSYR